MICNAAAAIIPTAADRVAAMTAAASGSFRSIRYAYVNATTAIAEGIVAAATASTAPERPRICHAAPAQNARRLVPGIALASPKISP